MSSSPWTSLDALFLDNERMKPTASTPATQPRTPAPVALIAGPSPSAVSASPAPPPNASKKIQNRTEASGAQPKPGAAASLAW